MFTKTFQHFPKLSTTTLHVRISTTLGNSEDSNSAACPARSKEDADRRNCAVMTATRRPDLSSRLVPAAAVCATIVAFGLVAQLYVSPHLPEPRRSVQTAFTQSLLQKDVFSHESLETLTHHALANDPAGLIRQHTANALGNMTLLAGGGGGGYAMRAFSFDSDCVRGPGKDKLGCRPDKVPDDMHYNLDRKHHHTGVIPQGGSVVSEVNFGSIGAMASDDPDLKGEKDILVIFYGRVHIEEWDTYKFCTTSKDGARVWVDGAILANADGKHGSSQTCGSRNLMPGLHDVRMDGFQLGDGSKKLTYSSTKVVVGDKPVPSVNDLSPRENWDANTGYSIRVWVNFPPMMPLLAMPAIYDQTPFAHGKLKDVALAGLTEVVKDAMLPKVGGVAWDVAGVLRIELEGPYSFCAASVAGMKLYVSNHEMINRDGPIPVVDCGEVHLRPGAYQIYASGFSAMASVAAMVLTYFGPDTNKVPMPIPSVNNAIRPAPKNGFRMFLFENMPGKGAPSGMAWARPDWQQFCNPIDKTQKKEDQPPGGCSSYTVPDPTKGNPPPPVFCCFTPPLDQKGDASFEFLVDAISFYTPLDFIMRAVGFGASGFAYQIYGTVYVDTPGTKTICVTCADGCRVWFDDILMPKVISDGLKFAPIPMCQPVFLNEGAHPFIMDGFQNQGLAMAIATMDGMPIHSVDAQLPENWKGQVGGMGLKAKETDQKLRVSDSKPNTATIEAVEEEAKHIRTPEEQSIFEEVLGILDLHESNIELVHAKHTRAKNAVKHAIDHAVGEPALGERDHSSAHAAAAGEPHDAAGEAEQPGAAGPAAEAGKDRLADKHGHVVRGKAAEARKVVDGAEEATKRSLESTMAGLQETRAELGKLMYNNGVLSNLTTVRPMTAAERAEEEQRLEKLSAPELKQELNRRLRAAEQKQLEKVEARQTREDAEWRQQEKKDLGIGQGGPWGLSTWGPPKPLPNDGRARSRAGGKRGGGGSGKGGRRSLLYTTETKGGSRDSNGEVHPGFRYPSHKHEVGKTWGRYDLPADAFGQQPHTAKELWKPLDGSWKGGSWKDADTYDDKGFPTEVPSFYYDGVRKGGKYGEWHDGWMDYWHDFHDDERKVAADGDAWRLVHRDLTPAYISDWKPQFDPDHPDYMPITHGHNPNQYGPWGTRDYADDPFDDNCCGPQRLRPGAFLRSEDQLNYMQSYGDLYRFTLQEHGDLTMFYMGPADERANGRGGGWTVWSSKTMYKGSAPYRLWMKPDCNLVVIDSGKTELWSSGTAGKSRSGTYCSTILHEDGVVTINDMLGAELWRMEPDKDPYYWVTRYKNNFMLKIPGTSSK